MSWSFQFFLNWEILYEHAFEMIMAIVVRTTWDAFACLTFILFITWPLVLLNGIYYLLIDCDRFFIIVIIFVHAVCVRLRL